MGGSRRGRSAAVTAEHPTLVPERPRHRRARGLGTAGRLGSVPRSGVFRSVCVLVLTLFLVPAQAVADHDRPTTVAGLLAHYRDLSVEAERAGERVLGLEQRIAEVNGELAAIDTALAELDGPLALSEADQLDRLLARATRLRTDLDPLRAEHRQLTVDLPKRMREVEAVLEALPPEQLALLSEAPPSIPAPPGATRHPAVEFALAQVGKPYVWGAEGPDAYDCSGLVQTAFATAGVQLPRVSIDQSSVGEPVDRAQMRAGDLVFYYSPVHHVAMAIDNRYVVHAASLGVPIKVDPVDAVGPITVIRRVT
ncbi:C40 family peptidase [Actinokineospora sp. 24-640]